MPPVFEVNPIFDDNPAVVRLSEERAGYLNGFWNTLEGQLNPFNRTLIFSEPDFEAMDPLVRLYVRIRFEYRCKEPAMYVREGSEETSLNTEETALTTRIFLGPVNQFTVPEVTLVPNEDGMPTITFPNHISENHEDAAVQAFLTAVYTPTPGQVKIPYIPKASDFHIPRPPNAWILYRKEWHFKLKAANPGIHNNEISIILGRQWNNESPSVREKYKDMAAEIKREFQAKYPSYKYKPRPPGTRKHRAKRPHKIPPYVMNEVIAQQMIPTGFAPLPVYPPGELQKPDPDAPFTEVDWIILTQNTGHYVPPNPNDIQMIDGMPPPHVWVAPPHPAMPDPPPNAGMAPQNAGLPPHVGMAPQNAGLPPHVPQNVGMPPPNGGMPPQI